jgi:ferredoxin
MVVESETPAVLTARRTALELLLADHLGDCLAPCQRVCPLDLDVARLARQVRAGEFDEAAADLRRAVPFPGVTGRVCSAPCESACRRRAADDPVSVREIERHLADREGARAALPACRPDTGRRVAVVGGGPAGLAAAWFLRLMGHAVTVFEREEKAGGRLRHGFGEELLPAAVLDRELGDLGLLGAEIRCGAAVGTRPTVADLLAEYDAVVVAAAGVEGSGERPGLFAAGDAIRRIDDPTRAMASGRDAARAVDAFLSGRRPDGEERPFTTTVGRLTPAELAKHLEVAEDRPALSRRGEPTQECTPAEVSGEGGRCLGCACRAADTCLLKRYGETLSADPKRFRVKRRLFTLDLDHPFVVYEPGKCIACGICVAICREMGEVPGLAFIGRGFDVRVGVPFDEPLRDALRRAALRCVAHCPTGALLLKEPDRGRVRGAWCGGCVPGT